LPLAGELANGASVEARKLFFLDPSFTDTSCSVLHFQPSQHSSCRPLQGAVTKPVGARATRAPTQVMLSYLFLFLCLWPRDTSSEAVEARPAAGLETAVGWAYAPPMTPAAATRRRANEVMKQGMVPREVRSETRVRSVGRVRSAGRAELAWLLLPRQKRACSLSRLVRPPVSVS
jgi:hypothetical protein